MIAGFSAGAVPELEKVSDAVEINQTYQTLKRNAKTIDLIGSYTSSYSFSYFEF